MRNRHAFLHYRRFPDAARRIASRGFVAWLDVVHLARHGRRDLFSTVQIETNSLCNRRCSYCPNTTTGRPAHWLAEDTVDDVLGQLAAMAFRGTVVFSGYNEPTLDPRLPGILERTRAALPDNPVVLYTNGDAIDELWLRRCADLRVELNVTLHGARHRGAAIERAWRRGPRPRPVVHVKRGIEGTALSTRGGLVSVDRVLRRPFCHVALTEFTIMADGNVVLCSDDYREANVFGNVSRDSILAIWDAPAYRRVRREMRRGGPGPDLCRHCR